MLLRRDIQVLERQVAADARAVEHEAERLHGRVFRFATASKTRCSGVNGWILKYIVA